MSKFTARFTRYNSGTGQRLVSAPVTFYGLIGVRDRLNPDFSDAVRHAETLIQGMKAADPTSEFEIVSITTGFDLDGTGHYRGEVCTGPGVWEIKGSED